MLSLPTDIHDSIVGFIADLSDLITVSKVNKLFADVKLISLIPICLYFLNIISLSFLIYESQFRKLYFKSFLQI